MSITRRKFLNQTGQLSLAASLGLLTRCSTKKDQRQPNIILFYSDELPPSYLNCYDGKFPTPNLDSLASAGIRFVHSYVAAPMCTPSRYALLTGQLPGRCKHPNFLEEFPPDQPYSIGWNAYIDSSAPTIARILSKNGYVTGMAGKWHIGKMPESVRLPQIPEDADPDDPEVNAQLQLHQRIVTGQIMKDAGFDYAASAVWENFDMFPLKKLRFHNFPWITKGAVDFMKQRSEDQKPFFLYVATTAVHGPNHVESLDFDPRYTLSGKIDEVNNDQFPIDDIKNKLKDVAETKQHAYAGMRMLDSHIGIILKKLTELALEDNTIVIYMSDHNIEPGKATTYERGTHVPFIIRWPEKVKAGITSDALVGSVDILPTVLEAAKVPIPDSAKFDGKSLLPILKKPQHNIHEYLFTESGHTRAVTDGRYKYIAFRLPGNVIEKMKRGELDYAPNHLNTARQEHSQIAIEFIPHYFDQDQLYNLENDPYEMTNLANDPQYAEILDRLKKVLSDHLSTFDHPFDLSKIPFMESERYKQLAAKTKSLGLDWIPWYRRDHGGIVWPPKE